jgi:hypothetical protein
MMKVKHRTGLAQEAAYQIERVELACIDFTV